MKKINEGKINPMRAKWPGVFALLTLLVVGVYMLGGGATLRLVYGFLAMAIILLLTSYKIRKFVLNRPIGSMDSWRQAHVYLGSLCVIIVLIHADFAFSGDFGKLLAFLFALVTTSGVVGSILYKAAPLWLSKQGADALVVDEKRKKASAWVEEAEELIELASDEFKKLFDDRIRPLFAYSPFVIKYLLAEEGELVSQRKKIFGDLQKDVPLQDSYIMKNLETLYSGRDKMEFNRARVMVLRWWLVVHVPAYVALLTALFFHMVAVLYF